MIPLASRDSRPMWDQVAQSLSDLLDRGAFLPGEALPQPEALAWQMVVNPTAVRRAYATLEARGLLEQREDAVYYRAAERER